jgi:hypothetical protein
LNINNILVHLWSIYSALGGDHTTTQRWWGPTALQRIGALLRVIDHVPFMSQAVELR